VEDVDEQAPVTGDPVVDSATAEVAALLELPPKEHVAGYEQAHRALHDRLADVEG
jgi:hypothetical protein